MHFIRLWELDIYLYIYRYIYIYIYIVQEYIQLYIVYDLQEPLGILLKWEHNVYLSSSKEVEVVSVGGAAPIVFQLLIRGMSLLVLARIGVRVTRPGRRRICGSIVFGQNALMPWSRALRAGPSGEERCTPHYTVPVSPQCPQEISLLTLPVF